VIAEQPTRTVVKRLTAAGWSALRTRGSHTQWACPTGAHQVTVPDGHRTLSPGVVRVITKAMDGCDCEPRRSR
jgi:predicted RNA binding protein YcfA (HicA-like mRNA interferase family)